jgi:uncharacterized protein YegL
MATGDRHGAASTRAPGLASVARAGLTRVELLPLRLFTWIAIILLLISGVLLFLGFIIGPLGASSREGIVQRNAERSVVFSGSEFDTRLKVNGATLPICSGGVQRAGSAVALVIDNSSSMESGPGSALEEAKSAAQDFVRNLNVDPAGDQIAVVRFDDGGQILYPLGSNANDANQAIADISSGSGTAIHEGLRAAQQALAALPPGRTPIIVLLTDGGSDENLAITEANQAKSAGVRLITIGLGGGVNVPLLQELASEPKQDNFYQTADPRALQATYQQIAAVIGPVVATNLRVQETYDARHFTLVDAKGDNPGVIEQRAPAMTTTGRTIGYRLRADSIGYWSVSPEPGLIVYDDCKSQPISQNAPEGPRVLVLPPLLWLLLPFLIGLLWLLFRLFYWYWKNFIWEPPLAPRDPRTFPPRSLPAPLRWAGLTTPWQPEPALVIGLGGTGRWVLTHLKRNLLDAGGGTLSPQIRLLALDTAAQEFVNGVAQNVEFAGATLTSKEQLVITDENLNRLIEQVRQARPGEADELSEWFPADYYQHLGPAQLDLAHGTGGRRPMGRIAIFRNLKDGLTKSTLWNSLTAAIREVRTAAQGQNIAYQRLRVMVVGSTAGGFGSGSMIDVAYLARRACENVGLQFTDAEVSLYLVGNAPFDAQAALAGVTRLTQINTRATLREVERFLLSRNRPFPIKYKNGPVQPTEDSDVLQSQARNIIDDCWFLDGNRGQHSLASRDAPPERALFPMIADAMMVLLDTRAQGRGAALGALRQQAAGNAQTLQLELGQAVFSSFGAFTYRLPMNDLITFLRVRFARQLLAFLITGDPEADLSRASAAGAGRGPAGVTPRSQALNFMAGRSGSGPAPFPLQLARAIQGEEPLVEHRERLIDVGLRSQKEGDSAYVDVEGQDFQLYLQDAVSRLLNGGADLGSTGRAGKLPYTQAFLQELATLLRELGNRQGWERQRNLPRWTSSVTRILPEILRRYERITLEIAAQLKQQEGILRTTVLGEQQPDQATCVLDELVMREHESERALQALYTVSSVRRYLLADQDDSSSQRRQALLESWYKSFFEPNVSNALEHLAWKIADQQSAVFLTAMVDDEAGVGLSATNIPAFADALLRIAAHASQNIWQRSEAAQLMASSLEAIAGNPQHIAEIHQRSEPVLPYVAAGAGQRVSETRWLWTPEGVTVPQWVRVRNQLVGGLQPLGVAQLSPIDGSDLFSCTALYLRDYVPTSVIEGIAQLEQRYLEYYGMRAAIGIGAAAGAAALPEPSAVFPAERHASEIFERRMLQFREGEPWLLSALFVGAVEDLVGAQLFLQAYAAGLVELKQDRFSYEQICVLSLSDGELQLTTPDNARGQVALEVFGMQNFVLDSNDQRLIDQRDWGQRAQRLEQTMAAIGVQALQQRWLDFDQRNRNRRRDPQRFGLDDLIICARILVRLDLGEMH